MPSKSHPGWELMRSGSERPGSDAGRSAIAFESRWLMVVVRSGSRSVEPAATFTAVLRAVMLSVTTYSLGSAEWISITPL